MELSERKTFSLLRAIGICPGQFIRLRSPERGVAIVQRQDILALDSDYLCEIDIERSEFLISDYALDSVVEIAKSRQIRGGYTHE